MASPYDRTFTAYRGLPTEFVLAVIPNPTGGPERANTTLISGTVPAGLEFINGYISSRTSGSNSFSIATRRPVITGTPSAPAGIYKLRFSLGGLIWTQTAQGGIQEYPPSTYPPEVYDVTIEVIDNTPPPVINPPPVVDPPPDTNPPPSNEPSPVTEVLLTWFQARAEALAGARIRRAEWADRWLEFSNGWWWIQRFNPISKATGTRLQVKATDWNVDDFRAVDFTLSGIPGQIATAGSVYPSIDPALQYP